MKINYIQPKHKIKATNDRDKHMRLMDHSFEAQIRYSNDPIVIKPQIPNHFRNKRRLLGILPKQKATVIVNDRTEELASNSQISPSALQIKRLQAVKDLEDELFNQRQISTLMYRKTHGSRETSNASS